jgi:hypothetical protein
MLGSLFYKKYNKDPKKMSLSEIEDIAIKDVKFLSYAKGIVNKRVNIFKNKKYNDIDKKLDAKLASYGI